MNLTKKERYNLSKKILLFKKRKVLLDQIRKEYKIITKRNKKTSIIRNYESNVDLYETHKWIETFCFSE